ncbi:hypothetical protein [Methanobacterium petrolearium]|uniref:hypothetical protein n=1 Tax=Methanobacterium petrolearium TaxID=710190 RepID=UPI00318409BB|nr:hypothetical protein GCM10025861_11110 [Methanobacterium petrolearium]
MIMGLAARSDVRDAIEFAGKLADFLTEKGVDVLLDIPLAQKLDRYQNKQCALEDMDVDMMVAVGEMELSSEHRVISVTKKFH